MDIIFKEVYVIDRSDQCCADFRILMEVFGSKKPREQFFRFVNESASTLPTETFFLGEELTL